jgi:hypothetical protein
VGDYPIGQLVLYPKDFGWMVFLRVEPRSVDVALAEGLSVLGGTTSVECLRDGEAGRTPFELCPDIRPTTEEKHGKPQSGQPSSHRSTRCGRLGSLLWDSLGWPAGRRFTSVTRVTSVSPRSAQVPPDMPD